MRSSFRLDIVVALIIPMLFGVLYAYYQGAWGNILLLCALLLVIFCEIAFLNEIHCQLNKDNGIISTIFISLIFTVSWLSSSSLTSINLCLAIILLLAGIFVRAIAKMYLAKNFSYSLRIKHNHQLIKNGIYAQIRHPAYLGTLLIIAGATTALDIKLQIFIILAAFIFAELRSQQEEKMLLDYFKDDYKKYISKTNKYVPYIY